MKRSAVFGCLLSVFGGLCLSGCPKPMDVEDDGGGSGGEVAAESSARSASENVFAVPQESLRDEPSAIKVSGEIVIEGYEKGIIQVDVTRSSAGGKGVQPVTIARFKQPGPFELLLPKGTEKAYLYAFLDIEANGPTIDDPRGEYADNPVKLGGKSVDGITIAIDINNIQKPPPADQGGGQLSGIEAGTGEGDRAANPAGTADAASQQQAAAPPAPAPGDGGAPGATGGADQATGQTAALEAEPAEEAAAPMPEVAAPPPPTPRPEAGAEGPGVPDMLSEEND